MSITKIAILLCCIACFIQACAPSIQSKTMRSPQASLLAEALPPEQSNAWPHIYFRGMLPLPEGSKRGVGVFVAKNPTSRHVRLYIQEETSDAFSFIGSDWLDERVVPPRSELVFLLHLEWKQDAPTQPEIFESLQVGEIVSD